MQQEKCLVDVEGTGEREIEKQNNNNKVRISYALLTILE